MSARFATAFTMCQMALGVIPAPQILSSRLTRRKIAPLFVPAALIHSSTARFVHVGTGTVRMCFPLPIKSAITQCFSRTWKSSAPSPTSSARRSPHPLSSARIARSRFPRFALDCACRSCPQIGSTWGTISRPQTWSWQGESSDDAIKRVTKELTPLFDKSSCNQFLQHKNGNYSCVDNSF